MEKLINLIIVILALLFVTPFGWVLLWYVYDTFTKGQQYENIKSENDHLLEKIEQYKKTILNNDTEINQTEKIINNLKKQYNKKLEQLKNEKCKDKLYALAEKIAEKELEDFDDLVVRLTCKNNPAYTSAEKVKEAKNIAKEFEKKYKLMKYEYDLLFELFPELDCYLDKIDNKQEEIKSINELKEDFDNSSKYLSKEEYENLSEVERNQIALDRYIDKKNKSKWQIGRDYELFIGHLYEKKGYRVKYTGIEQKLEDMGRDLIAENDKEILVIQCKYWSSEKTIHEKHICQLYGTTIHYKKTYKPLKKVKGVFVTKTSLSTKAKEFAKYLKIQVVENKEIEAFPRIKCNINKGNRIYHLPFDQQYDNTKIDISKGEMFATTVFEAVSNGFRRAKKWYG